MKLPREFAYRKPRQLSGGQKQRIGIARAFGGNAERGGRRRAGLGARRLGAGGGDRAADGHPAQEAHDLVFISHDLSVVRYLADRIVVMYLGPHHGAGHDRAGLRAALSSLYRGAAVGGADRRHPVKKKHIVLKGEMPSPIESAAGLPVPDPLPPQDRRHLRDRICRRSRSSAPGHKIMCHLPADDAAGDGAGDRDHQEEKVPCADAKNGRESPLPAQEGLETFSPSSVRRPVFDLAR